ncbi:MAG: toxin-activating lysine-acyltransferase [Pseudomonadota bacterium]
MTNTTESRATTTEGPVSGRDRPVASAFGDIINVLMRTETFRDLKLRDLDWLVMPALQSGQFALAHGDPRRPDERKNDPPGAEKPNIPIAVVLWAHVSEDVDSKLRVQVDAPFVKLAPEDWRSGEIPWIVAAGGLPDALRAALGHMARDVFPGNPANILINENGVSKVVKLVPPAAQDNHDHDHGHSHDHEH